MANEQVKVRKKGGLGPVLRGFKPAVPATVGSFALTFLFAVMMPLPWVSAICWNLYLDTIHPIFAPPLGNGARVAIALAIALIAGLIALVIALAMVKPAVKGNQAMNRRVAARAKQAAADDEIEEADSQLLRRRRVDSHPDAPLVAPINAARDLPAGGLGPVGPFGGPTSPDYGLGDGADPLDLGSELLLGDEAEPLELGAAEVLQDAADGFGMGPASARHGPNDRSLGAMVARFEHGLDRRKRRTLANSGENAQGSPNKVHGHTGQHPANEDDGPVVDLALEAALATLQRMSRAAVG